MRSSSINPLQLLSLPSQISLAGSPGLTLHSTSVLSAVHRQTPVRRHSPRPTVQGVVRALGGFLKSSSISPLQLSSRPLHNSLARGLTSPVHGPHWPRLSQSCSPCLQMPTLLPQTCLCPGVHTQPSSIWPLQLSSMPLPQISRSAGRISPSHAPHFPSVQVWEPARHAPRQLYPGPETVQPLVPE